MISTDRGRSSLQVGMGLETTNKHHNYFLTFSSNIRKYKIGRSLPCRPRSHNKKPLVINTATEMVFRYNPLRLAGFMAGGGARKDEKRVAQAELPSRPPGLASSYKTAGNQHQARPVAPAKALSSGTHGSKTKRVMYSFGIRGSWWENTFCKPTSHIMIFLLGFWFRELPTTWNSITPLRSSSRAASSRAECAERKLVCAAQKRNKITFWRFHIL